MASSTIPDTSAKRAGTASHIESMLLELRQMSNSIEADFLTYLLEMALMEATDISNGRTSPTRLSVDNDEVEELYMKDEING